MFILLCIHYKVINKKKVFFIIKFRNSTAMWNES